MPELLRSNSLSQDDPKHRSSFAIISIGWIVLFVGALCFDRAVAQWVAAHHPIDKHNWLVVILKLPGVYWTTLAIAGLLAAFHPQRLRAAVLPLASGAMGGLAYLIIKWVAGRRRPIILIAPFHFEPFIGGWKGLFSQPALCFPSGHACLSFATALSLTILMPRWRGVWFLIAFAVAIERVLENAHYVSDVVAGAGLGTLCVLLTYDLLERRWPVDDKLRRGFE